MLSCPSLGPGNQGLAISNRFQVSVRAMGEICYRTRVNGKKGESKAKNRLESD
jgi:hypothetical protein